MSRLKESMQWHYLLFLTYFPVLRFYFYYSVSWLEYIMSYALRAWDYLVFISSFSGLGTLRPTLVILFIPYLFCFLVWVHFVLLRFKLNLFGCICISLALGFSLYQFLVTSSLFCSGLPALLRLFNLTVGQRHGVYKLSR